MVAGAAVVVDVEAAVSDTGGAGDAGAGGQVSLLETGVGSAEPPGWGRGGLFGLAFGIGGVVDVAEDDPFEVAEEHESGVAAEGLDALVDVVLDLVVRLVDP